MTQRIGSPGRRTAGLVALLRRWPRPALPARVDPAVVVLLALPWLVLLADPQWVYGSLYRDAWAYFGLFQNLPGHLHAYAGHYSTGRLSVTLPGWLAYSVFPPATANLLLHVGLYYAATLAGYAALAPAVGRRAAFLAVTAMGGHTFFLKAVGWDYTDGFVLAYFLLALALLTRAARSGWWKPWLVAAGAAGAAVVVANVGFALLLPPLAVFFVLANRAGGRHPLDAAGFWAGAGFVGLLAGFAVASRALGGPFLFLNSTLAFIESFDPDQARRYVHPPEDWADRAAWLVFPVAAAVGAVVALGRAVVARVRGMSNPTGLPGVYFQVQFLALFGYLLLQQCRRELGYLEVWHAASSTVMVTAFVALGGQLRAWSESFTPGRFRVVAAAWCGGAVLFALDPNRLPDLALPLAAALGCGLVAVLAPQVLPARAWVALPAVVALGVMNVTSREQFRMADSVPGTAAEIRLAECQEFEPLRKPCFHAVAAASQWARDLDRAGRVWFWYDIDAPLGPVYDMAAHTNFHYLQIVNTRFPDLGNGYVLRGVPLAQALADGGVVVVFSPDPEAGSVAAARIRKLALDVRLQEQRVLGRDARVLVHAVALRVAPKE